MADTEVLNQAEDRSLNNFAPIPDVEVTEGHEFSEALRKFSRELIDYCESLRESCDCQRQDMHFEERLERDERRAIAELLLYKDDAGDVIESEGDGYACMNLTHGWTSGGVRNVGAFLTKRLLHDSKRIYTLNARGDRPENEDMEELLYTILDELLKDGKLEHRLRILLPMVPRQMISIMRYEMGSESKFRFNARSGKWEEMHPELVPQFQVWPIEDVFVTNVKTPDAQDQEAVFWRRHNVTIQDLQCDEMVMVDIETETGQLEKMPAGGKFRNLEAVRNSVSDYFTRADSSSGSTSVFPQTTLIEMQGALPIQYWAETGLFTPEVAEWFGVDVGFVPDIEDEGDLADWARRLGRIPWNVSYLSDWSDGGQTVMLGQHLLQCEPDRSKEPRNSCFAMRFSRDGLNWYGRSLCDIGKKIEEAADMLLNAHVRAARFNSNPSKVINKRVLGNGTIEEANRLLSTPGMSVEGADNKNASELVHFNQLPTIDSIEMISTLHATFEAMTGPTANTKGNGTAPETGTLGEIELNKGQSEMELEMVAFDLAEECSRMVRCVLEDFFHYNSEEAILSFAEKISGKSRSEIARLLPSLDGIEDEVEVTHPMTINQDRAVATTLLLKLVEMFPDVFANRREDVARAFTELAGAPEVANLIGSSESMSPDDEHSQMRAGNIVEPSPAEDFVAHLQAHMQAFRVAEQEMQAMQQQQGDPTAIQEMLNLLDLLPGHVQDTMNLMQAVSMQMQAMNAEQQGGVPTKEGKSAPQGNRPANSQEMSSNIQGQANGVVQ